MSDDGVGVEADHEGGGNSLHLFCLVAQELYFK